jgi:Fe-S cluster biogenesis protein NfuA
MTQQTPNPFAVKFIVNRDMKTEGKVTYTDPQECMHVPLAVELLRLPNVTQIHFFENVITVTQNGASDWAFLEETIQLMIETYADQHDPDFVVSTESKDTVRDTSNYSPDMKKIDEILERTVRPYLQADGGDLELVDYDDHVLSIRYEGACGGCPSSMSGTLQAIEGVLQNEFDDRIVVVAV